MRVLRRVLCMVARLSAGRALNRTAAPTIAMLLPQRKMAIAKPADGAAGRGPKARVSRERRLLLA
jgi:hypothetical protein